MRRKNDLKNDRKNERKNEKISVRKLALIAAGSCLVTLLIAVCAFSFLFLNFEKDKTVIEIPNLVGQNISDVERASFFGLRIEKEPVFSEDFEKGVIISQKPHENSKRVLRDHGEITVTLTVSLGREELCMPELVGYDCYEAACILRELGAVVRFASVYRDGEESDRVISASRAEGEIIEKGDRITLFVSRRYTHDSVKVRDYHGMKREQVISRIMMDGLTVGDIILVPSEDGDIGCVIGQSLIPGIFVSWGTKIDITVAERYEVSGFYNGDNGDDGDNGGNSANGDSGELFGTDTNSKTEKKTEWSKRKRDE